MTKTYYLPMHSRLEPCRPWRGGRITDTDLLTLEEAARDACRHSGQDVSVNDFLRAAARGEITLRAIVHASAKVEKFDGGIFCNQGEATENIVPKGAIPTLPLVACLQLANVGSARWRTFDGFEIVEGDLCRFTVATLADGEPDFETTTTDCRVIGFDVHALADAFASEQSDTSPHHQNISDDEPEKRLVGWKADAVENWLTILQLSKGEPDARDVAKFLVNIGTLFKVAGKRDAYTWKPTNSSDGREKPLSLKTIQNSMPELFEMAATRKNPG